MSQLTQRDECRYGKPDGNHLASQRRGSGRHIDSHTHKPIAQDAWREAAGATSQNIGCKIVVKNEISLLCSHEKLEEYIYSQI